MLWTELCAFKIDMLKPNPSAWWYLERGLREIGLDEVVRVGPKVELVSLQEEERPELGLCHV